MKKDKVKKQRDSSASVGMTREVEVLKGQLARALADYDNLRKRTEEEKITWMKFAGAKVIAELLPVLDMIENAQKHLKDGGLSIVINEFKNVISEEGFEEIPLRLGETDFN